MMNKINIISILCICIIVIFSCENINDLHEKYLDDGEVSYIGRVDSVKTFSGFKRILFEFELTADPRCEKVKISWDNDKEFEILPIANLKKIGTKYYVTLSVKEGNHIFKLSTLTASEKASLTKIRSGVSYGDDYKSTLNARKIKQIALNEMGVVITWETAVNAVVTKLYYNSSGGGEKEIEVENDDDKTIISDFVAGSDLRYKTLFLPNESAIDNISSFERVTTLPEDFEMDKSKISHYPMYGDFVSECWGGSISNLINGVVAKSDYYHTGCAGDETDGLPHFFTFDLGGYVDVSRLKLYPRQGCCQHRNPKHIQIWGITDVDGADLALSPKDEAWEQESIDKGWLLLFDGETDPSWKDSALPYMLNFESNNKVRYIRVRIMSLLDEAETHTHLSELTFYVRSIE